MFVVSDSEFSSVVLFNSPVLESSITLSLSSVRPTIFVIVVLDF